MVLFCAVLLLASTSVLRLVRNPDHDRQRHLVKSSLSVGKGKRRRKEEREVGEKKEEAILRLSEEDEEVKKKGWGEKKRGRGMEKRKKRRGWKEKWRRTKKKGETVVMLYRHYRGNYGMQCLTNSQVLCMSL